MHWRDLQLPDTQSRAVLGVAAVLWCGVALISAPPVLAAAGAALVGAIVLVCNRPILIAVLLVGLAVGALHSRRVDRTLATVVPGGPNTITGVLTSDPHEGAAMLKAELGSGDGSAVPLLLRGSEELEAGHRVVVAGTLANHSGLWRGQPYAGVFAAHRIVENQGPINRWFAIAGAMRHRVGGVYEGVDSRGAGLVRGFLIGDTSRLSSVQMSRLTDAGLSHFVAVSGSNVALFLALVWVVGGPLSLDVRSRAALGAVGLVVFTLVTRWEASVVRAAVMAGLLLGAKAVGYPLRAWTALGVAVTVLLTVSPELATSVGFQLSVGATIGVMMGSRLFPGIPFAPVRRSLAAAVGAQAAVAPLLLWWFGSVPLVSPLANLIAAPFVASATALGGIGGLTGFRPLAVAASEIAAVVLDLSEVAANGPQLGIPGVIVLAGGALIPWRRVRYAALGVGVVGLIVGSFGSVLAPSSVVFLDIGQGDAALVKSNDGTVMLIDGGPDPAVLLEHLRSYRIGTIAVVVVSHPDEDHVGGLVDVVESYDVAQLWHPGFVEGRETFDRLVTAATERGAIVLTPSPGDRYAMGNLEVEVLGPLRRYESANDQSLVLRISSRHMSVLFAGDVERIAQRDLGPFAVDVLKVPHHGAATSDLDWLHASAGTLNVISVGSNSFGHPDPEVAAALGRGSSCVVRTDLSGNIELRLEQPITDQLDAAGCGNS